MATELRQLVAKRGYIKGQLTRFNNFVSSCIESQVLELQARLDNIYSIFNEFNQVQAQIESISDDLDSNSSEREAFEDIFYSNQAAARKRITDFQKKADENTSLFNLNTTSIQNNVKLPSVTLPEFRGELSKWLHFHDTFTALIDSNKHLSDIEKFYYLRGCLKGEAEQVLQALEVSSENYNIAWQLLKSRFENKRVIIEKHVQGLFEITNLTKESHVLLRKLLDEFNKHIRAFKSLGEPTDSWDTLLIYVLRTKLDSTTKREWQQHSISLGDKLPTISEFITFISNKCQLLETINTSDVDRKTPVVKTYEKRRVDEKSFSHLSTKSPVCNFCKNTHYIFQCKNFQALPIDSRINEIKKLKLCLNCLRDNHFSAQCRSSGCKKCHKKHNTLLHLENANITNSSGTRQNITADSANANEVSINAHCKNSRQTQVLLSTAIIHIKDHRGNFHKCRTLLDSGSQSNFMSNDFFQKLNLHSRKITLPVSGISQTTTVVSDITNATIKSAVNAFQVESFLVVPEITGHIPNVTFDITHLKIPSNITLADPNFNVTSKIDVLLGAEIFWNLLCVGQIKLGPNQPILHKSKLGWILSGPVNLVNSNHISGSLCNFSTNMEFENQLERFWKLEELPKSTSLSLDELECERIFVENVKHDESGHFEVRLPTKNNKLQNLGESQGIATKRFYNLECKLMKNPNLRKQYVSFMSEYIELGHMSKISESEITTENNYYLPHHGVIKEDSATTKLRVVFDASCQTSSGISLNDCLMVGPTIQDDLFSILIRFRKHNYVLTADITKMYRQVNVVKEQRNLQRIVWRSDPNEALEHYVLNTVTYGTACASFLAIRALHEVAYENEHDHPISSKIILTDFYVDDLLTGSDTIETAISIKHELTKMLNKCGFELRKWLSNESLILENSINSERELLQYYITDDKSTKALGISWNAKSDILNYNIKNLKTDFNCVTKRTILSTIAQIFDPLGLIGPVVIRAKIILQTLWRCKVSWDESLPVDIHTKWLEFAKRIPSLNDIQIKRHAIIKHPTNIEIHGFSDASLAAYGACVYLRSCDSGGNIQIQLLCAKSRVAPLQNISLPRLELCGALLLSQLVHKTQVSLKIHVNKIYLWTDSTIVLSWLAAESSTWQTFVANRVSQIQGLTNFSDWNHVSSEHNPADIISRGIEPSQLAIAALWWNGPEWLTQDVENWPKKCDIYFDDHVPETRKVKLCFVNLSPDFNIFNRFSSLFKLQRVMAYCMRFIRNTSSRRGSKLSGELSNEELRQSLMILTKIVQGQVFQQEIHDLNQSETVSRNSKLLMLNPFLDENGTVRVGGRIGKSTVSYDQKFPIVLPEKHIFTKLIIRDEHHRQLHAGPQAVLASIRHNYWPLNGRNAVRGVLRKCVTCFRVKPRDIIYQMGDLPKARVTPTRPFKSSGVDYAGPFNIKDGKLRNRKIVKGYVCIFVCFSTKAIHIEVVSDLSARSFLNALKRFVSRRGICSDLYSDNATNFVGAEHLLKGATKHQILDSDTSVFLGKNNITWHHIPPRSPHFGGLWEAAVKAAKYHMKRIIGNANLTFEELYTVMSQIEASLNSRPISPLSNNPNDLVALTPGHFLIGDSLNAIPQTNVQDIPINKLNARFQYLQRMYQHFWSRWSREYLSTLQQRGKWKLKSKPTFNVGDMVILKEDNAPPLNWKLGRITEAFPGSDDIVRVVNVKTKHGVVRRSVKGLCVLPSES